jgi:hypothetical protein
MKCAGGQWVTNPPLVRAAASLAGADQPWCVRLQPAANVVQRLGQLPWIDRGVVERTHAAVSEETAQSRHTSHIRALSTLDHGSDLE